MRTMKTTLSKRLIFSLDVIRCLAMWLAASVLCLVAVPRPLRPKKQVLLVRLDAIGDFVLWLDAVKEIRRLYPPQTCEITLLGNASWTPLARELSLFDRVWSLERRRFLIDPLLNVRTFLLVRRGAFDVAISPVYSREFKFDLLVKASRAPQRIGSEGDSDHIRPWQRRISDRWYSRLVPARSAPLMELERNAEFVRGLGAADFRASVPRLPAAFALPPGFNARQYVVLVPGASLPVKRWPVRRFGEIAARIHQETEWAAIVCGGPGDQRLGEILVQSCAFPVENWCGKTSLTELAAILQGARLVVTNDTGAVHLAAAASVPSVCITGGGHPGRFMPYRIEIATDRPLPIAVTSEMDCSGCHWLHCHYGTGNDPAPCLSRTTADMVWHAVHSLLPKRG